MMINGVEKEQAINFDYKKSIPTIIDLLLLHKVIPTYMEEPDYLDMLKRYKGFQSGSEDFNDLNTASIDYEDLLNEPENFADDPELDNDFSSDE